VRPGLRQLGDARSRDAGRQGGAFGSCRAHHRAERLGQGAYRTDRASELPAPQTPADYPTSCSRQSSLARKPAPTRARRSFASDASKRPTAAPCSWTRSATCRPWVR
jgi:hypothetical protein